MTINVDPAEITKFSELAHRWWDPGSEFKPLHDINPLRLGYIDNCAGLNGKPCSMSAGRRHTCRKHGSTRCPGNRH
jgi:2-polyprenyl-3-methyl-5-hydroxy-6-metoxy-1,4-benzoquinol methylase